MLDRLKRAGLRLAILSNGNPEMLDPMVAASGLGDRFEAVLSVDAVQVFKPDPRVYRLVEAQCGVTPHKVCFLSSNCWDAHGAAHFGFATVWVNRAGAPDDNLPGKTVATIKDLSQLPLVFPDVLVSDFCRCPVRGAAPRRYRGAHAPPRERARQ
jgi:2-haloacid dehalogenase